MLTNEDKAKISNLNIINGVNIPADDAVIWRYMSFSRFEQMINDSAIYLARIDQFADFTEGSFTHAMAKRSFDGLKASGVPDVVAYAPQKICAHHNNYWYASCWNANKVESNLFWRAYGSPKKDDKYQFKVAIKTTAKKLISSINQNINYQLYFGEINYIDFDKDDPSADSNYAHGYLHYKKKQEYQSEHEIRLAIFDIKSIRGGVLSQMPATPIGISIPVDLDILIDEIYVEAVPKDQLWQLIHKEKNITNKAIHEKCVELINKRFVLIQAVLDRKNVIKSFKNSVIL